MEPIVIDLGAVWPSEAARKMSLSRERVRQLMETRALDYIIVGGRRMVLEQSIEAWRQKKEVQNGVSNS